MIHLTEDANDVNNGDEKLGNLTKRGFNRLLLHADLSPFILFMMQYHLLVPLCLFLKDVEQNLKMDPKRKVFMFYVGFEKMERGLSEKYHDRESPVKRHMDHMVAIGAAPGLINPQLNTMTSDVVKVREC